MPRSKTRRQYGGAPLHDAVKNSDLEKVKQLISEGANVNAQTSDKKTALMMAVEKKHIGIVSELLAAPGINVNIHDTDGWTALMMAVELCSEPIVDALLSVPGINVNAHHQNGYTALIWAAKAGCLPIVKALLAFPGIDVNAGSRNSALLVAIREHKNRPEIAMELLAFPGIDVTIRNVLGQNALMIIAQGGSLDILNKLLTFPEININETDDYYNDTALMKASAYDNINAVNALLAVEGINVNLKNRYNKTALDLANLDTIRTALLNAGAVSAVSSVSTVSHVIPVGVNRPIVSKTIELPSVSECFDPYMASTVNIADNQVLFYIFEKGNATNTKHKFVGAACIDNEVEENGTTILLYKKFLEPIEYVYYRCLPTVSSGALHIPLNQIEPEPIRRLAFDRNIYVYENQVKHIKAGHKYALIPTETKVGRIVSKRLLQTGQAVSAEHCQTDYTDVIHEIFEITSASGGAMRKRRRMTKRKRNFRKRTYTNHV
jgi:ankyrin repeat protein